MTRPRDDGERVLATNRKALFHYEVLERLEAGLALVGTEVKSIRDGGLNFSDSWVEPRGGQLFLVGCRVAPYSHGNLMNHVAERDRKLLLHRKEINKLIGKTQLKGLTLVPLRIYFSKRGHAKVELALAKGKKQYDRRESIKAREAGREVERAIKSRK